MGDRPSILHEGLPQLKPRGYAMNWTIARREYMRHAETFFKQSTVDRLNMDLNRFERHHPALQDPLRIAPEAAGRYLSGMMESGLSWNYVRTHARNLASLW